MSYRPTEPQFWSYADPDKARPSLPFLKEHFQSEGRLTEEQVSSFFNMYTGTARWREENGVDGWHSGTVTMCAMIAVSIFSRSCTIRLCLSFSSLVCSYYRFLGDIHSERDNPYSQARAEPD